MILRGFILGFVLFFTNTGAARPDLELADMLFQEGKYQEAINEYEKVASSKNDPEKLKALYRTIEGEALLRRYQKAFEKAIRVKMPEDTLWRARFLMIRSEIAKISLSMGNEAAEPQLRSDYAELWKLRDKLAHFTLKDETYFYNLEDRDLETYPTVLDFFIARSADFFREQVYVVSSRQGLKAELFLGENFSAEAGLTGNPLMVLGALYESGSKVSGKGKVRDYVREYWKIQRWLIPYSFSRYFQGGEKSELDLIHRTLRTLVTSLEKMKTDRGKAKNLFESAQLYQGVSEYQNSVQSCMMADQRWPALPESKLCRNLVEEIKRPVLELVGSSAAVTGGHPIEVRSRNLAEIEFRAFALTFEEIKAFQSTGFDGLRGRIPEEKLKAYLNKASEYSWKSKVEYSYPHQLQNSKFSVPFVQPGFYLVLSTPKDLNPQAVVVHLSDLMLVGTSGLETPLPVQPGVPGQGVSGFHLYAFDGKSGQTIPSASIDYYEYFGENNSPLKSVVTDPTGLAQIAIPSELPRQFYYRVDPLLKVGNQVAFLQYSLSLNYQKPEPFLLKVDTDRAIYRPGQKVQFKLSVLERGLDGFQSPTAQLQVELVMKDPNGKEVDSSKFNLNDFGSASSDFKIPMGRILGSYSIEAKILGLSAENQVRTWNSIQVEEYRRPEFEVVLDPVREPSRFGSPVQIQGKIKYYFGLPVAQSNLKYRVSRQKWMAWPALTRGGNFFRTESEEVAIGETISSDQGIFKFQVTPQPDADSDFPSVYQVTVTAVDGAGRAATSTSEFKAGEKALLLVPESKAGFFSNQDSPEIQVRLFNLNEQELSGKVVADLERVEDEIPVTSSRVVREGDWSVRLKNSKNRKRVFHGEFFVEKSKDSTIKIPAQEVGVYELSLKSKDTWGSEVVSRIPILIVDKGQSKNALNLDSVTRVSQTQFRTGDLAQVLLGSNKIMGPTIVEVWRSEVLKERRVLNTSGIQVIQIPIEKADRGGLNIRWFGAGDSVLYTGDAFLSVPWEDKVLKLSAIPPEKMIPGSQIELPFSVLNSDGKPLPKGEATLRVYDRSLDALLKVNDLGFENLYPTTPMSRVPIFFEHQFFANAIDLRDHSAESVIQKFRKKNLEPPSMRFSYGMVFDSMAMVASKESVSNAFAVDAKRAGAKADANQVAGGPPPLRQDLSESAYFDPKAQIIDGKGKFKFKLPDTLTSWVFQAFGYSMQGSMGSWSGSSLSQKDLMVRVDIPRFAREKDFTEVKALVTNSTNRTLDVDVSLLINEGTQVVTAGLLASKQDSHYVLEVEPGKTQLYSWKLLFPEKITQYSFQLSAKADDYFDSERRDLVVLPRRVRLVDAEIVALTQNGEKTIELKKTTTSTLDEKIQLRIDPNLILSLFSAVEPLPTEEVQDVLAFVTRSIPVMVLSGVFHNHPAIVQALTQLSKEEQGQANKVSLDPLTQLLAQETPWFKSKDRSFKDGILAIEPTSILEAKTKFEQRLIEIQGPSGGYPWVKGGPEDFWITLEILELFAESSQFGVEFSEAVVKKPLEYLEKEMKKVFSAGAPPLTLGEISRIASTARVFAILKPGSTFLNDCISVVRKKAELLSPYGKAVFAEILYRVGDRVQFEKLVAQLLDGAQTDPVSGVSFAPEPESWVWYRDSLRKHAFIVSLLSKYKPSEPKLAGLAQWLLFQKKAGDWKNPMGTAYSLLALSNYYSAQGQLSQNSTGDSSFQVTWGKNWEKVVKLQPHQWLTEPLTWVKEQPLLKPSDRSVKITKQGGGLSFASLSSVFSTDNPLVDGSSSKVLAVERQFFRKQRGPSQGQSILIKNGESVKAGEEIEVQLKIKAAAPLEYVYLRDPRAAGFEPSDHLSGWMSKEISYYREIKDSSVHYFLPSLPQGEVILKYMIRATSAGVYQLGPTFMQSVISSDVVAYSNGHSLTIDETR